MSKLRVRRTHSVRRRDVLILPGVERAEPASDGMLLLCFGIDGQVVLILTEECKDRVQDSAANPAPGPLLDL